MTNAKRKTNVKERYEGQTGQLFQNKNQQGEVRSCKTHIRTENCMILEQNGLVVIGEGSFSSGCGFNSHHRMCTSHFNLL